MSERGKGRFLPGNKASPGRPKRFIEQKHLKAQSRNLATLHKQVTPDMVATIVKRAIVDAVHGDAAAREWLSRYILPPLETINATALAAVQVNIQQDTGTRTVFITPEQASEQGWDKLVEGMGGMGRT